MDRGFFQKGMDPGFYPVVAGRFPDVFLYLLCWILWHRCTVPAGSLLMITGLKTDSRLNLHGNSVLFFPYPGMRMLPSTLIDSSRVLHFCILPVTPSALLDKGGVSKRH
jgi:hypothetical protein